MICQELCPFVDENLVPHKVLPGATQDVLAEKRAGLPDGFGINIMASLSLEKSPDGYRNRTDNGYPNLQSYRPREVL